MTAIRWDLQVEMDGGGTYVVSADQRDVATFEQQDFYTTRRHTMVRFLAYAAAVRQGKCALTWEQFSVQCVMVGDVKPEDEQPLDPGRPDPSPENSSRSSGDPVAGSLFASSARTTDRGTY